MNPSFSKIWILVILIIVLAGGILAWQYFGALKEEVKDETADWKTYKNEEYKFEIKYPRSWDISEYVKTSILIIQKKDGKKDEKEDVAIDISERRDGQSLEEVVNARISSFARDVEQKEIYVGDERGYELIGKFCSRICTGSPEDVYSTFVIVYISHNNKIYTITYSEGIIGVGWKENIEDYNYYDEFKKIISTFRFLE